MEVNVIIIRKAGKLNLKTEKGVNLLQLLINNNILISSPCGGNGNCGKCKVRINKGNDNIISGTENNLLTDYEIEMGYRLACCVKLNGDMELELPEEEGLHIVTEGMDYCIDLNPDLNLHNIPNEAEGINTMTYLDSLYKKTFTSNIDLDLLPELPYLLERENISLLSFRDKIISITGENISRVFGLAIDIGTTTIAVYLINILTGEEIDVSSFHNPQKKFGADVISRVNYVQKDNEKLKEIQSVLIEELNQSIIKLTARNGLKANDIYIVTVVANTIMSHFLLAVDPVSLTMAPYRPIFTDLLEISPEKLNIKINPHGIIQILPALSSYIGSDIIADLLITDFSSEEWNLLIDIGTNGEIVLGNKEKILACSTAAGPAFEGANITFGMAGVPGAISGFKILDNGNFQYETIDNKAAVGICGSGIVDVIAEMLDNKIIDKTGMISDKIDEALSDKLRAYKNMKAVNIADGDISGSVLITQKDIREVQLAKGAVAAGIKVLLKKAGVSYKEISNVYLAGGFGSFINPVNACKIGLLPEKMEKKIIKIGNGAGLGAKTYLLDKTQREKAKSLVKKIEYLELSLSKDFQEEFLNSLEFQEGNDV